MTTSEAVDARTVSTLNPENIIPSLDGIRALAVSIVFLSHADVSRLIPGGFGVTTFFFLSGYLITTLLAKEVGSTGSLDFRAFFTRRLLRLLPPLLATLAISMLAAAIGIVPGDLGLSALSAQLLFVYNYYLNFGGSQVNVEGLSVLWSLSVEEHFYLLWPTCFVFIYAKQSRVWFIVFAAALILAWRSIRFFAMQSTEWEIFVSTDTRADSLLYGCLLALSMRSGAADRLFGGTSWRRNVLTTAAIGMLLASFVIESAGFRSTLRYSIQGIALLPLFYYAIRFPDSLLHRPLNWAAIRKLGAYSYSAYLIHFVVIIALERAGLDIRTSYVSVPIAAILTVAWAAFVSTFVEERFRPMRAALRR